MTYVLHITISDVFSSEKVVTEGMVEGMKLEVRDLKKTYGTVQALKGISYTFTPGVYGILGANGAGKSTMINLITDNVSRDKVNGGSICYEDEKGDEDILKLGKQFRALVGYMPQQQGFYEDFSPKAFLKYMFEEAQVGLIIACHMSNNPASGRVMEKAGMKYAVALLNPDI